ncbi:MAG: efflux RND transporter periplasmic adaptor subunit [Hyphomonadaceae bacterium]|nr:efflux RND transporter periplasmic adaptor subunit [Hyphomonadaceae bacterium]
MKRALIAAIGLLTVACAAPNDDSMQGYGEAEYIYLASQETGVVRDLAVREGDIVEAGARIYALDPDRLTYSAQSARAQSAAAAQAVRTAQAQAALAQSTYQRGAELFERGFYSRARLDADRAALDAANAQLARTQREAGAAGAASSLARTRLNDLDGVSPAAGSIERIYRRAGEVVPAGQPIVALLTPENMKVRFFAPQAVLSRLPVGARVMVSCDGCSAPLPAVVSYVAREPQFTPPVIYSLEEREKLVFLVEARFSEATPIRPGMPVDVRIAP